MLRLNYTARSRKPIATPVYLKPRHRGSDTAHMWRTAPGFLVGGRPEASAEPSVHRDPKLATAANGSRGVHIRPLPRHARTTRKRRNRPRRAIETGLPEFLGR